MIILFIGYKLGTYYVSTDTQLYIITAVKDLVHNPTENCVFHSSKDKSETEHAKKLTMSVSLLDVIRVGCYSNVRVDGGPEIHISRVKHLYALHSVKDLSVVYLDILARSH